MIDPFFEPGDRVRHTLSDEQGTVVGPSWKFFYDEPLWPQNREHVVRVLWDVDSVEGMATYQDAGYVAREHEIPWAELAIPDLG